MGDGWLGLPFRPGALPDVLTAIVFVNPAPSAEMSTDSAAADMTIAGIAVSISTDHTNATVTTDSLHAEVTA
jgi:hypothetical protein